MRRRDFIKTSALASTAAFIPNFLQGIDLMSGIDAGFKRLVIIQLSGGNDGLNTVVPFNNDIYYEMRPKLSISKGKVLQLNDELGLHPAMTGIRSLFDDGKLSIVNNVGYPNPDRSHFRSLDIWHSASNSDEFLTTGWLGRYMDSNCTQPHEIIEVNDTLSLAVKGELMKGLGMQDAKRLYETANEPFFKDIIANSDKELLDEDNLGYLYKTMIETYASVDYVYETTKVRNSTAEYPGQLGQQLKTIAQFINSGLSTRVYYATLGGFDTHVGQENTHENLLRNYSDSVEAFVKDLRDHDTFQDTLILTFSEFGRRVKENASQGTDHGTANNLFIIGDDLKTPGFYNEVPDLSTLDDNGDIQYSVDFRRVYADALTSWMDVDADDVLGRSFDPLGIV